MKSVLLGVASFALALSFSGCAIFGPAHPVILLVDEIDAPASIAPGAPLSVVLSVVTGGCRSFSHIETQRTAARADLTVWGRDASKGRNDIACPLDVRMETHTVRFEPPFASIFTVSVDQDGRPARTATVRVE
jgi:hypothetical protein